MEYQQNGLLILVMGDQVWIDAYKLQQLCNPIEAVITFF